MAWRISTPRSASICAGDVAELPVLEGCLCGLLTACEHTRDVGRAEEWLRSAEEVTRRGNLVAVAGYCRAHYAGILVSAGRWAEAEGELAAALDVLPEGMSVRASTLCRLADLRIRQGRLEEGAQLLDGLEHHEDACLPLVSLHLARSEAALAAELIERALASGPLDEHLRAPLLSQLVDARIAMGDHADAASTSARLTEIARGQMSPYLQALAAAARARVCVATGEGDAREGLHQALSLFGAARTPVEVAAVRLELARLSAPERPTVAVAEAGAALVVFEAIGDRRRADEASAFLRSLGATGPPGPKRRTPHPSRGRGARPARARSHQHRDRRTPLHQPEDRGTPRRTDPVQAGAAQPHRGGRVHHAGPSRRRGREDQPRRSGLSCRDEPGGGAEEDAVTVSCESMVCRRLLIARVLVSSSRPSVRPRTMPISDMNAQAPSASAPTHIGSVSDVISLVDEAGVVHDLGDGVGIGETERPGPSRLRGRQVPAGGEGVEDLGEPLVVLEALPGEERDPAVGSQPAADVGERGDGIGEEHRAEDADRQVVGAGSKRWTWASACRNSTFVSPSSALRRRASSSIREERSTPSTDPAEARRAASRVDLPVPHPMSRTRSVGSIATSASNRLPIQRSVAS